MEEDTSVQITSVEGLEILLSAEGASALKQAQRMLIGKVLTGKQLNKPAVKDILAKAWGFAEEINIIDLGPNTFLFNFSEAKHAKRAMEESPWFVMGHLLSLQHWVPEATIHEVNFDEVGFWIQLHGLPLEFMSNSNAVKVAHLLGI
ncbi:hypothetical protein SESBI_09454 [Sesbania bispinosa]|nr:hypothetical protein SESBI_09454 [Sesbania bispinosa]